MRKILEQPFDFEFVDIVYKINMYNYIGLPPDGFNEEKRNLYRQVSTASSYAEPMTKICVFLDAVDELEIMDNRLKWSKQEFSLASFLIGQKNLLTKDQPHFHSLDENERLGYYKKLQLRLKNQVLNEKVYSKGEYEWVLQHAVLNNENKDVLNIIKGFYF